MRQPARPWSWRSFAIGAVIGLLAASLLGWLLKLTVLLVVAALIAALVFGVLGGSGLLPHVRRVWRR